MPAHPTAKRAQPLQTEQHTQHTLLLNASLRNPLPSPPLPSRSAPQLQPLQIAQTSRPPASPTKDHAATNLGGSRRDLNFPLPPSAIGQFEP